MKILSAIVVALLVVTCTGCGTVLVVGESGANDVIRTMGEPRMQWTEADGSRRLVYPHGPMGVHTDMVIIGADGKLLRIENTLDARVFARIAAGMSKDQVLHVLGPPEPSWTAYFKARDELVWEWRYCDDWNKLARFDVLFDGSRETVRSTQTYRENCGSAGGCWCSR